MNKEFLVFGDTAFDKRNFYYPRIQLRYIDTGNKILISKKVFLSKNSYKNVIVHEDNEKVIRLRTKPPKMIEYV